MWTPEASIHVGTLYPDKQRLVPEYAQYITRFTYNACLYTASAERRFERLGDVAYSSQWIFLRLRYNSLI